MTTPNIPNAAPAYTKNNSKSFSKNKLVLILVGVFLFFALCVAFIIITATSKKKSQNTTERVVEQQVAEVSQETLPDAEAVEEVVLHVELVKFMEQQNRQVQSYWAIPRADNQTGLTVSPFKLLAHQKIESKITPILDAQGQLMLENGGTLSLQDPLVAQKIEKAIFEIEQALENRYSYQITKALATDGSSLLELYVFWDINKADKHIDDVQSLQEIERFAEAVATKQIYNMMEEIQEFLRAKSEKTQELSTQQMQHEIQQLKQINEQYAQLLTKTREEHTKLIATTQAREVLMADVLQKIENSPKASRNLSINSLPSSVQGLKVQAVIGDRVYFETKDGQTISAAVQEVVQLGDGDFFRIEDILSEKSQNTGIVLLVAVQ